MSEEKKLPAKQEQFCREYLIDLNATQAYLRVYKCKPTAAESNATRLMGNDGVKARIDELKEARIERTEITADTILRELLKLATVDISQAFDAMGGLLPLNEMPEDVRKAISGIEINEMFDGSGDQKTAIGLNKKLRFWDKPKCLELLGKHLKLFTDRLEATGKDGKDLIPAERMSDEQVDQRIESLVRKALSDS